MTCSRLFPAIFVNHGGGPLPLLGKQEGIANHLKEVVKKWIPERPSAIVVLSAHWEEDPIKITASPTPSMLYDYYGFPKEAYEFQYPAPGNVELSVQIKELLQKEGIKSELDEDRGFDHGVFVPLMLMYPAADIPVVCVSLHRSRNAALHLSLGKALMPLREDKVLILASGYSFHNMQSFFHPSDASHKASVDFNDWLKKVILDESNIDKLVDWDKAPGARLSHPREEHLMPLLVVAGAAGKTKDKAELIYDTTSDIGGHAATGYLFA